jgi:hypothetical protein
MTYLRSVILLYLFGFSRVRTQTPVPLLPGALSATVTAEYGGEGAAFGQNWIKMAYLRIVILIQVFVLSRVQTQNRLPLLPDMPYCGSASITTTASASGASSVIVRWITAV